MASARPDPLKTYRAKRDFAITSEPRGEKARPKAALSFVIQKHAATRLHYDFRLELGGVLLSWAVPKGPSFDPTVKRMAIHVEDHPLSYGGFEGTIPPKQYGAGTVIVWDRGTWAPVGDAREGLAEGKLVFELFGQKLAGLWELVKIAKPGERQEPWLLFKKRDAFARPHADYDVVQALPDSVIAKPLTPPSAPAASPAPKTDAPTRKLGKAARIKTVAALPGAAKAELPRALSPQLATLSDAVPASGDWTCEPKWDGYRIVARIEHGEARLITRNGHDWTDKMPAIARELSTLNTDAAWLDGEIVVLGDDQLPSFGALQQSFDGHRSDDIVYFLFDAPFVDGYDLRKSPLFARRDALRALLASRAFDKVRLSEDFDADPASLLASACEVGLEGIIVKRRDSTYTSRRTDAWLKLKCKRRQEFVIGGYTDRANASTQVGSLLLGVYDDEGKLQHAGSTGTGWTGDEAAALHRQLVKLKAPTSPFATRLEPGRWTRRGVGSERWVEPKLVAEVEFAEWTRDGHVRHGAFVGLRLDKPARDVRREHAATPGGAMPVKKAAKAAAPTTDASRVRVTHGERVIDATSGATKLDLVRYYESIAEFILPHLRRRPVSLVRGPSGVAGQLFFQKHGEKIGIPGIRQLDPSFWPEHAALLEVDTVEALVNAAQMNVIEFHTWNSTTDAIDRPDRIVFDLDPGEGTTWKHVQEGATLVHAMLDELKLESWLKTSGGKGLHVVVPIATKLDYDTVKDFSRHVVTHLAATIPSRFVAKSGGSNRVGKIFVDYLRNGHGATTATAFSARARPGLGVSMPLHWDDLPGLKSGSQWTIATAREYLSFQKTDPWAGYWKKRQSLTAAMKALGMSKGAPSKA